MKEHPSGSAGDFDALGRGDRSTRSLGEELAGQRLEEPSAARRTSRVFRETFVILVCVLLTTWAVQTFVGRQYVIPSESMEQTLHGCQGCANDRIVIDKIVYRFSAPKPGDVVVFKAPTSSWNRGWRSPRSSNAVIRGVQDALSWFGFAPPDENNLVKRVVAVGGQRVECHSGDRKGVQVNGAPLVEPYVDTELQKQNAQARPGDLLTGTGEANACYGPDFGPITVPDGMLWVMGDNRGYSADSRFHRDDELGGMVPVSDVRGKVRFIIYPLSRIGGVDSVDPDAG